MIPIKSMVLHNPLFLAGTNLGMKLLDTKTGLKMYRTDDHYVVTYNNTGKFVEKSNVADAEPVHLKDLGLEVAFDVAKAPMVTPTHNPTPMKANISKTAQVSDPTRGMR